MEDDNKKEDKYKPVSLALSRRVFPSLFANKLVGVQPMSAPSGLAYAMRQAYNLIDVLLEALENINMDISRQELLDGEDDTNKTITIKGKVFTTNHDIKDIVEEVINYFSVEQKLEDMGL